MNSINLPETKKNNYVSSLKALPGNDDELTRAKPDQTFFLYFDQYKINHPDINHPQFYPLDAVEKKFKTLIPQMNRISMVFPPSPPLSQFDDIKEVRFLVAAIFNFNCYFFESQLPVKIVDPH